jgi:hypothetical protein
MVLYASINKEYVNEDLRVNKEVVKRQFKHVATSSNTYKPKSKLEQSMMYNFGREMRVCVCWCPQTTPQIDVHTHT